jgi:DNA-binding response OmpR family regulator
MHMAQPTVLFVDDEPTILFTLSSILRQKGFEVTGVATVSEALELIGSRRFDVLISDLNIGEPGDGFTVVSAMRRVQPQAITFILTGYPDFESALIAIRNQVDDYFTKPMDINALVTAISDRLNRRGPTVQKATRLRRVSDVLRDSLSSMCEHWLQAVLKEKELAAIPLSLSERSDHVPALLTEFISRIERSSEDTSQSGVDAAEKHGRMRYRQGYSIPQIVSEARLLQRVLTNTVQANLLGVDLSSLVPDLVEIGESLATLLELSIRAYQEEALQHLKV